MIDEVQLTSLLQLFFSMYRNYAASAKVDFLGNIINWLCVFENDSKRSGLCIFLFIKQKNRSSKSSSHLSTKVQCNENKNFDSPELWSRKKNVKWKKLSFRVGNFPLLLTLPLFIVHSTLALSNCELQLLRFCIAMDSQLEFLYIIILCCIPT